MMFFQDEHVLVVSQDLIHWLVDLANYVANYLVPLDFSFNQKKKFLYDMKKFSWDEAYLYHNCANGIICRCVPEVKMLSVLEVHQSSPVGGHHNGIWTAYKILPCGYYLPTIHQDARDFVKSCNRCQREGGISKRDDIPINSIFVIE